MSMRLAWACVVAAAILSLLACRPPAAPAPTATPTATTAAPTVTVPPGTTIADAPAKDPFALARAFHGVEARPLTLSELLATPPIGTVRRVNVLDATGPRYQTVEIELRHVGEHGNWWVRRGADVAGSTLANASNRFDDEVYPFVIGMIAPGLELPGRVNIVNASLSGVAGYFSAADTLPDAVEPASNQMLAVFMNSTSSIGADRYTGTLAHELQHLVHFLVDRTEETWLNEGLSEYVARAMGLPALPHEPYLRDPSISLTTWPLDLADTLPHYGAASLFIAYLAHRVGDDRIAALIAEEADSIDGVAAFLGSAAPGLSVHDLLLDWLTTNVAGAPSGRYAYPTPPGKATVGTTIRDPRHIRGEVAQYGAWYAEVIPGGSPLTIQLKGSKATPVVPGMDGGHCWWSNRGDSIATSLTHAVDLTGASSATLTFRTWLDIEYGFDHGYVAVSEDGGTRWTAMAGRLTSDVDPLNIAFGPSYTGAAGWAAERMDLSPYAGKQVLVRFMLVNDDAVHGTGWCVDDIAVPEIGWSDDAETPGDWNADGFVRVSSNGVPQRFLARLIEGTGADVAVRTMEMDATGTASLTVDRAATLLVTAVAPKTSQPATFELTVSRD